MSGPVYEFEEIGQDLARPPFAALRALQAVGMLVAPKGWTQLSLEGRQTLTSEGARERVDLLAVRTVANGVPATQIKLVSRTVDPKVDALPAELLKALGPQRTIPVEEWRKLSALDRFVLSSLAYNTRLLWRALDELERHSKLTRRRGAWAGAVARCEIHMRPDVLVQMMGSEFLDGRALVLARGAGRRAARRASETFDLQADTEAGPIELDWGVLDKPGGMLWQAHVSGWDGAFLPAASLQAALTAAVAIYDMVKELDPRATISFSAVADEPWLVGNDGPADLATRLFSKPAKSAAPTTATAAAAAAAVAAKAAQAAQAAQAAPSAAPTPAARPQPVGSGTVRLDSPLATRPAPQAPPSSTPPPPTPPAPPASNPLPSAPPPSAPRPAAPASSPRPVQAPPASTASTTPSPVAIPSRPAQRIEPATPGTADETLQLDRFKPSRTPMLIALVVVGLVGAGLLGYVVGR